MRWLPCLRQCAWMSNRTRHCERRSKKILMIKKRKNDCRVPRWIYARAIQMHFPSIPQLSRPRTSPRACDSLMCLSSNVHLMFPEREGNRTRACKITRHAIAVGVISLALSRACLWIAENILWEHHADHTASRIGTTDLYALDGAVHFPAIS